MKIVNDMGFTNILDLQKSKYIKRTGTPGNYKYFYAEGKKLQAKGPLTNKDIDKSNIFATNKAVKDVLDEGIEKFNEHIETVVEDTQSMAHKNIEVYKPWISENIYSRVENNVKAMLTKQAVDKKEKNPLVSMATNKVDVDKFLNSMVDSLTDTGEFDYILDAQDKKDSKSEGLVNSFMDRIANYTVKNL